MIIAAAIKSAGGQVYWLPPPSRHHDVLRRVIAPAPGQVQGFIDRPRERGREDRFVDREEARDIVMMERQPLRDGRDAPSHPRELFSEDLW